MKKVLLGIIRSIKQFLENIKISASISILLLSFSAFYLLAVIPNKKLKMIESFEILSSTRLTDCVNTAIIRQEKDNSINCKSKDKEEEKLGRCTINLYTEATINEVYNKDREFCADIYKARLNFLQKFN